MSGTDLRLTQTDRKPTEGFVPQALVELFKVAPNNTSKFVIKQFILESEPTPHRRRRIASLQLYSKTQALVDLMYAERKRNREIERKQMDLLEQKEKLVRSQACPKGDVAGGVSSSALRRMELAIEDTEDELAQIEDQRRLNQPLLQDAEMEYTTYLEAIQELDAAGDLGDFEAGEEEYFRMKVAHEARLDLLANSTCLSRNVLEQLMRVAPEMTDKLIPENARPLLRLLETGTPDALIPAPPEPAAELPEDQPEETPEDVEPEIPLNIAILILKEKDDHPVMVIPETLRVPPNVSANFMTIENMGTMMTSRVAALRYLDTQKGEYDFGFIVDGNLSVAADTLALYLAETESSGVPVGVADSVAGKYGNKSPLESVTNFNPSVMLVSSDFASMMADYLAATEQCEEYWRPGAGVSACMCVVDTESARVDMDTQAYWSVPKGFIPPVAPQPEVAQEAPDAT